MGQDGPVRNCQNAGGMKHSLIIMFCALVVVPVPAAFCQVSGFGSLAYGYHESPLNNYENIPDRLTQGYIELNALRESPQTRLGLGYVGGYTGFETFNDRNYYEHSLTGSITTTLNKRVMSRPSTPVRVSDDTTGEDQESTPATDFTINSLLFALKASARHDKLEHRDFDNYAGELLVAYKPAIGRNARLSVTNTAGYRNYTRLPELSNITESLAARLGRRVGGTLEFGIQATGGLKYYTSAVYDTALFESQRTYVQQASGKGKGGAKLLVPSSKQILISPGTSRSFQISPGVYLTETWSQGSFQSEILYRNNLGTATRYLAQYVNTTFLSEDIYNDHFSYGGPGIRMLYRQQLPWGFRSSLNVEGDRKEFSAPALDLEGAQIADRRLDNRVFAEWELSHSIHLSGNLDLDVTVTTSYIRNQSNDNYNDFSAFSVATSMGIGF